LRPHETGLGGEWLYTGNRIECDVVCARIEWRTAERVQDGWRRADGCDTLYRDLRARLTRLGTEVARAKYGAEAA
jgi:hypothetical protein